MFLNWHRKKRKGNESQYTQSSIKYRHSWNLSNNSHHHHYHHHHEHYHYDYQDDQHRDNDDDDDDKPLSNHIHYCRHFRFTNSYIYSMIMNIIEINTLEIMTLALHWIHGYSQIFRVILVVVFRGDSHLCWEQRDDSSYLLPRILRYLIILSL